MGLSERIDRAVARLEPGKAGNTRAALLRLRADCGCREGAWLMVAATAATVAYLVEDARSHSSVSVAAIILAVLFGSAAVGKALGIAIARMRLLLRLRDFER